MPHLADADADQDADRGHEGEERDLGPKLNPDPRPLDPTPLDIGSAKR